MGEVDVHHVLLLQPQPHVELEIEISGEGFGFRVQNLGFRDYGSGCRL